MDRVQISSEQQLFERLSVIARCVAGVLGKTCEVVVHDLRCPEKSVVDIVNGHITGRTIGSPLLKGPIDDIGMEEIVAGEPPDSCTGIYRTRTKEGRELKSSTAIFYDDEDEPLAAFCVNWDLTLMKSISAFVDLVNDDLPNDEMAASVHMDNPQEVARRTIKEVVEEDDKPVYLMDKADRMQLVETMWKRGVFLIKGSVDTAAELLDISNNTVYGYLSKIRAEKD